MNRPESPPPKIKCPPFEIYCGICHRWFLDDGNPQKHSKISHALSTLFPILFVVAVFIFIILPLIIASIAALLTMLTK
jgi:hypothetical protein